MNLPHWRCFLRLTSPDAARERPSRGSKPWAGLRGGGRRRVWTSPPQPAVAQACSDLPSGGTFEGHRATPAPPKCSGLPHPGPRRPGAQGAGALRPGDEEGRPWPLRLLKLASATWRTPERRPPHLGVETRSAARAAGGGVTCAASVCGVSLVCMCQVCSTWCVWCVLCWMS